MTKAITAPIADGFAGGVSVGIKTSGKKTILNGGIFQDDVALHFGIGQVRDILSSFSTPSRIKLQRHDYSIAKSSIVSSSSSTMLYIVELC